MAENEIEIRVAHPMVETCLTTYKGTMTGELMELVMKWHPNSFLEYKDSFSSSDYIDRISGRDLKHPIMWGFDKYNRAFIAIRSYVSRLEIRDEKEIKEVTETKVENAYPKVETFFQRYSEDTSIWTSGGNPCYTICPSRIRDEELEHVKNLIVKGETIIVTKDWRADSNIVYHHTLTCI